jgi:hypothetical protein
MMKADKHDPDSRLWLLMAKKLTGEANQDELIELDMEVQKNPDAHYVIEILSEWWRRAETTGKEDADQAAIKLLDELEKENESFRAIKKRLLIILPVA